LQRPKDTNNWHAQLVDFLDQSELYEKQAEVNDQMKDLRRNVRKILDTIIVGDIFSSKKSGSRIGSVVTWLPLVRYLLHTCCLLVNLVLTQKRRCNCL